MINEAMMSMLKAQLYAWSLPVHFDIQRLQLQMQAARELAKESKQ